MDRDREREPPVAYLFHFYFQASRDLLVTLGRETLKGEGDIVKHLAYLGVAVSQEQQYLEEFDFKVRK